MATVDIYNIQKEKVGELDLKEDIFGVEVRGDVLHEVVTWQRACRRTGSACTKTRGEVSGGGRKPWRQKGTGRARAGSNRSPVWKGGGTIFGPSPRSYAYTLPKKVRRLALKMALSSKLANGQLVVLEDYPHNAAQDQGFRGAAEDLRARARCCSSSPRGIEALELSRPERARGPGDAAGGLECLRYSASTTTWCCFPRRWRPLKRGWPNEGLSSAH